MTGRLKCSSFHQRPQLPLVKQHPTQGGIGPFPVSLLGRGCVGSSHCCRMDSAALRAFADVSKTEPGHLFVFFRVLQSIMTNSILRNMKERRRSFPMFCKGSKHASLYCFSVSPMPRAESRLNSVN